MPLFCWSMPWQLSSRVKLVFSTLPRFKGSLGKGRPSKVLPRIFVATREFKGCIAGTVISGSKVGRMERRKEKKIAEMRLVLEVLDSIASVLSLLRSVICPNHKSCLHYVASVHHVQISKSF